MNNQKYWEERQALNYSKNEKEIIEFHKELVESFEKVKKEIQKVINEFYIRYADNNGISYSKAQELLPKEEIGELKEYIAQVYATMGTKDINVINKSIRARVTRYEALMKQIEAVIDVLYDVNYKEEGLEKFKEIYKNSYYNTLYNIDVFNGFHTEFSILNIRDVETLIEYPFNGANYSSRIWKQKDHMITKLKENITTMLVQGKNPKTLSSDFAKMFKTKEYEAYRLLHTEGSFIIEQGTLKAYKEDGVEEYQILATLDTKTSDICREQDNKIYKIDEYTTGSTAPPFHHFCRTTTVPYYGDDEGTRKARDPVSNKSYDVPANMTYHEWYDKYIKNNPEALLEEKKWENRYSDKKQYKKYKEVLGKEVPKSLKDFQELKYNNIEEWTKLKENFKIVNSYKMDFGYVSPKKVLELDRLAFEAKRKNQISKYKKQGNFAVLEYNNKIKFASSRISLKDDNQFIKYKGDKDKLVLLKENREFITKEIGEIVDGTVNTVPRLYDTEAKFFEYLNNKVKDERIEEIFMLSEKAMCESCRGVAEQFIKKYPKIKVNVVSGKTLDGWRDR